MTHADTNTNITMDNEDWFDDYTEQDDEFQIDEYDLKWTPLDFNIQTMFDFIEAGTVKIPAFQRNYVWDIKRASKLIESLILELPVPQLFLYEQARNSFIVIDGQQRLMSIYYFMKQRFPRMEKRVELRSIFDQHGGIPDDILNDDQYFTDFKLILPEKSSNRRNRFQGLSYEALGDYKERLNLRPIRNIIVRQHLPRNNDSSIYEIFNRLNSGGINLRPQEIRASLYHSPFYDMLYRINTMSGWRRILNMSETDLQMKDIEILLRSFATLIEGNKYVPSLVEFLNQFSEKCKKNTPEQNIYLERLFQSFLMVCDELPYDLFVDKRTHRFNIGLFEAVFTVVCEKAFQSRGFPNTPLHAEKIGQLADDSEFCEASQRDTAASKNVQKRLKRAREILGTPQKSGKK